MLLSLGWFLKLCFLLISSHRCWSELFAVGLAQCSHNIHLSAMLSAIDNRLQTSAEQGDY